MLPSCLGYAISIFNPSELFPFGEAVDARIEFTLLLLLLLNRMLRSFLSFSEE